MYNTILSQRAAVLVPSESHAGTRHASTPVRTSFEAQAKGQFLPSLVSGGPPRPPNWGGYRLVPDAWEFWQGRKSRLHDRLRYRLDAGRWVRERLAP